MSLNSDKVNKVRGVARHGRRSNLALGSLSKWDDGTWGFVGDDKTSGTEVVDAVIDYESKSPETPEEIQEECKLIVASAGRQQIAESVAKSLLKLPNPNAPIPAGVVVEFSLKELIKLAAESLQDYVNSLNADGSFSGGWSSDGGVTTGSNIPMSGMGLTIPLVEP